MIGRPVKGTGFRGVLNYIGDKEHARLLGGDMAGRNPRELAHEFGLVRRQRPRVKRAVAHMFLRPAPGEHLSDEQWKTIAAYYLAGMGFTDSPHVLYLHAEPHPHLHLVASRITYGGKVVSDSNDYTRSAELLRNIERQYGLRVVSAHPELASPKPGDYGRSRRTGIPPLKTRLQAILAGVAYPLTLPEYLDHLHRHGVTLLPNIARTGRVSGISYVYEGQVMKGSDLGRDHTWAALARRLASSPGDPALLEEERGRAQEALGPPPPGLPTPAPTSPTGSVVSPSDSRRWDLADDARAILDRAAVAEVALLRASPETYPSRALEYSLSATPAENLLRDSLEPTRPRGDLESMARALLPEPLPPPTIARLEQLSRDDREAHHLLSSPMALDREAFNTAVERTIAARRELQLYDLDLQAEIHDAHLRRSAVGPDDPDPIHLGAELDSLYELRDRVEWARAIRELDLRLDTRSIEIPDFRAERELHETLSRIAKTFETGEPHQELQGRGQAALLQPSGPGLTSLAQWRPEDSPTASDRAIEMLEGVRSKERSLSLASPANFDERLAEYFESTGSLRSLVLDSFAPNTSLLPDDREMGHELAHLLLGGNPPQPDTLTLARVEELQRDSRAAFLSLLDDPGDMQVLATALARRYELDLTAFHAAVEADRLPRRGGTEDQNLEVHYLRLIEHRVELNALQDELALLTRLCDHDPLHRYELGRAESRLTELLDKMEYLEYLPRPARVAPLESHDGWNPLSPEVQPPPHLIDFELVHHDASAIADAFRSDARFSPEPPFFLPPTYQELPNLALEVQSAFAQLGAAEEALRHATPETYPSLALSHAAAAALAEQVNQQLATFGPEPLPKDVPADRLVSYLETRLQLHEAFAAAPSRDRDQLVISIEERMAEIHPTWPPYLRADLPQLLEEHRQAYRELHGLLAAPVQDPEAFRLAVARALDRHAELEQASAHLDGQLHARTRDHAILSSRLEGLDASEHSRLLALERQIRTLDPLYLQSRIAIADRDFDLLGRHLQSRPSSETLDRYTQLLEDREGLVARLRESRAEGRPSSDALDLGAARQAVLEDPSQGNLDRYRLAALAAAQAAEHGSFVGARSHVTLRRDELQAALRQADRHQGSHLPLPEGQADLRQAANRYLDARQVLADHAPLPPRRGTTFDYAAHARATDLSPAALDRLRHRAYLDYRRSPSPKPIIRPREPIPTGLSREQALPRAVRRLQAAESALEAQLKGIKRLDRKTSPRRALPPETQRRLVSSIDAYQQALTQVEHFSRSRVLLSPPQFLKHPMFHRRPLRALAAWTGYAARKGLPPSQIGRSLRSFGFPFVAGIGVRAAQSAVSRFFQDQVHER